MKSRKEVKNRSVCSNGLGTSLGYVNWFWIFKSVNRYETPTSNPNGLSRGSSYLSTPGSFSQCSHCNKKSWDETKPNLTGEIEDLKEFNNLRSINASNNQFTTLNGLFTLPNKNSIKSLNFFNNKISEIDLARLFTEFPQLEQLNLDYNPTSAKNLESLTSEQFSKLVVGMKNKKIKFSPYQGTILADLLEYSQKLINKGENTQQAQQLKKIIQTSNSVKSEKEPSKPNYTPFIVSGILVVSLALLVGYLVGKRRTKSLNF